jgi:hypothetical protein
MPSPSAVITSKPKPPHSQWRHKFITPKKNRKSSKPKTSSWINFSTPAILREGRGDVVFQEHGMKDENGIALDDGIHDANVSTKKVPITYEVMRSIVAALAYIEKCHDDETFHCFLSYSDENLPPSDPNDVKLIEETKQLILSDNLIKVNAFQSMSRQIVSIGLHAALRSCGPIIPESMEKDLYKIDKTASEAMIQLFLSRLPEVNMILCLSLFQHISKTFKAILATLDEHRSKVVLNQLACKIGDLIHSTATNVAKGSIISTEIFHFRKKKLRRRAMKTLIRYFMIETNVGHHNIEESGTSYPSDTIFGILENNRKRDDEGPLRGKVKSGPSSKTSPMFYSIDESGNKIPEKESEYNVEVEDETDEMAKILFSYGDIGSEQGQEASPSVHEYMTNIKIEALHQVSIDDKILTDAKRRLNEAEAVLKYRPKNFE